MSGSLSMPATGAVIQSVSQTKEAIGYVGLAYLCDKVKALAVSYDDGKHYVLPTLENGKKSYTPWCGPCITTTTRPTKTKSFPSSTTSFRPRGKIL